jgi:hypothetical protein
LGRVQGRGEVKTGSDAEILSHDYGVEVAGAGAPAICLCTSLGEPATKLLTRSSIIWGVESAVNLGPVGLGFGGRRESAIAPARELGAESWSERSEAERANQKAPTFLVGD